MAPDIRALGDLDASEEEALSPSDEFDLPPALPPERRRGALARLVQAWRHAQGEPPFPPASALAAADELASLIDQAALAGDVDWRALTGLALSTDLAQHWRLSAQFLEIVAGHWPAYLAETGTLDAQKRRRLAAEALARRWSAAPPDNPVIVAGSTGSAAASRILMRAVLNLPRGLVALPGLDPEIDAAGWKLVARSPSHPQHALHAALRDIGLDPARVQPWPLAAETAPQRARRRLVNEALAPAAATRGWNERLAALARPDSSQDLVRQGLAGVRLIETEDESEEALVAALLLRETLEHPTATAALVTPEAGLARRVAAILGRWGLDIAPSAGTPLALTPPGALVGLAAHWARDPSDPVLLLALLKHERTGLGWTPDLLESGLRQLEEASLRGPRRWADLKGLRARLKDTHLDAIALVERLNEIHTEAAMPLLRATLSAPDIEALATLAMRLCADAEDAEGVRLFAGRAGQLAAQLLEHLASLVDALGGIASDRLPDLVDALAREAVAPPDAPEHPRLAIWGPLEARLQRRDRMILASLNEGSWPRAPGADSLLNRRLRREVGLPDPDERVGLAAHDFAQLASAPDLVLLRAQRVDDKPAVASRWIWRLRTLAAGGLGSRPEAEAMLAGNAADGPLAWARQLRQPQLAPPIRPPAPAPPVHMRKLDKFSPSRVATLIRDPYADFAERILGLQRMRRPGEAIDALARGNAVHKAIEAFETDPGGPDHLERLIVDHLADAGAEADVIALERPLWLETAMVFLRWARARESSVAASVLEAAAVLRVPTAYGALDLTARADRIERLKDGTLAIIDYKSGKPATAPQVQRGLEPQLPLEAAMAARVAFSGLGPAPASQLVYMRVGTSKAGREDGNGKPLVFEDAGVMDVAEAALLGLIRLAERYADPTQTYLSRPRVFDNRIFGDFDRLARREEWVSDEGDE